MYEKIYVFKEKAQKGKKKAVLILSSLEILHKSKQVSLSPGG